MQLIEFSARNYRSIKNITIPVHRLAVFVGANGVGKTNLYRCLELLQAAASGALARELAAEGGMQSVFWAGDRSGKGPAQIVLSATLQGTDDTRSTPVRYEVHVGFRTPTAAAFELEPQIKRETLTLEGSRRVVLLDRENTHVSVRDREGRVRDAELNLLASETALSRLNDPGEYTVAYQVRQALLDWRFYHAFRTDRAAALRLPSLAVATPTLADDGRDLAAVFATLAHIKEDTADLEMAIDDAFPGARIQIPAPDRHATFGLAFADNLKRNFAVGELSDGTLQYLALLGALLSYRLPRFIALNEPEASLHPDLLRPLAKTIAHAASRTQVWLVTHSEVLSAALHQNYDARVRTVIKEDGATWIEGLSAVGSFSD